jgi:Zn-dependent peptidase ImmA (M78 family)
LKITRLDLDGAGSPSALVTKILGNERDLPIPVPIEELAERLDILSIEELTTEGFVAALVTDVNKATGGILLAGSLSPERRRYSIGHELGHFLIPTHVVPPEGRFLCSREDMLTFSAREQHRRQRMEFEANQFAAMLLMPPPILRAELARNSPSLDEVVRLARDFAVSKEAMARSYVDYNRSDIAIVRTRNDKVLNAIRSRDFPRIEPGTGDTVPTDSVWHDPMQVPGVPSLISPCEPDTWFAYSDSRSIEALTEQVLHQAGGFAMILLHAELRDEDDHDSERSYNWSRR